MEYQKETIPNLDVPLILDQLLQAILHNGGKAKVHLFR